MPKLKDETLAARKAQVEAAALRCFTAKGFHATTMRDIAQELGLAAGALYTHTPSKEELYAGVIRSYRERLLFDPATRNPVRDLFEQGCQFPLDIPALAAAIKETIQLHGAYYKLWYVDVVEFGGAHFKDQLDPASILAHPRLRARLDALREAGTLRASPELAFLITYMQLWNYFLLENLFAADRHYGVPEAEAVRAIEDVILNGVLR